MAISPNLELQGVIVATLKADPAVSALVGDRVFETVEENATFPYVTYSGADEIEEDADCILGSDIGVVIDVWSRQVGFPECKRIANAVRNALHDAPLTLSENGFVMIEARRIQVFRDPDGLTNHGIVELEAFIERT